MKNVLVTGGAGYIGSHTCKVLAERGYLPITYDNLQRGSRERVLWGPLVVGDILDKSKLAEVFDYYQPDAVLHFAAMLNVEESIKKPTIYNRNNVEGTLNLVETMLEHGVRKLVFSSSAAVYGNAGNEPIVEGTQLKPISPYGETKLAAEAILNDFAKSSDLSSIALRYFNAAGSDPYQEIGQDIEESFHLIPRTICAAVGKCEHLNVYGSDYNTSDGTCVRDYVHVNDIALAHYLALEKLNLRDYSFACNIGIKSGSTIREVISAVEASSGLSVPVKLAAPRLGDPPILICDNQLAISELGWQPEFNNLADIVQTDWDWFIKEKR